MSITDWNALFSDFNRRFFDGRLPAYRIRVMPLIECDGCVGPLGLIRRKRRQILIQDSVDEQRMHQVLIHEMAHAATNDYHGPRFSREILRLKKAGAPTGPEPDSQDGQPPSAMTRERLEVIAAEFFIVMGANFPVDRAVTQIARIEFRMTRAAFLHRFWWARRVIAEAHDQALMIEEEIAAGR